MKHTKFKSKEELESYLAQKRESDFTPIELAQRKYRILCDQKNLDSPSKEETKAVLQELIDCETDFAVKLAFTQIWSLASDYYK